MEMATNIYGSRGKMFPTNSSIFKYNVSVNDGLAFGAVYSFMFLLRWYGVVDVWDSMGMVVLSKFKSHARERAGIM